MYRGTVLWDAVVVGAGPAGATCALGLARGGLRVVILDKSRPPRYKTCGGGLVGRARRMLTPDIDEVIEHESHAAELHEQDTGLVLRVARDGPLVTMTMRSALDERLVNAAREAGAELRAPCTLRGLDLEARSVRVRCDDGPLVARFLVAADGAGSPTARAAGWPAHRRLIPALESELEVTPETHRRLAGSARFDLGLVPAGYAWVFPKRRHLSVGCLSFDRRRPDLRRHLDRYLDLLGVRSPLTRDDHGFVIPVAPRAALARGRILLTGDAAGLADPVTCEGISHAILSARLAAQAILRNRDAPRGVASAYQRLVSASILPELRRARLLARLVYGAPALRRLAFSRLGQPLCERVADLIAGDVTYRELLGRPRTYLRAARLLLGWSR